MDFRMDAINSLFAELSNYSHYTFLSATPIKDCFEIEQLKSLPHYKVVWDNVLKISPFRRKTPNVYKALCNMINCFNDLNLRAPSINGGLEHVKELYIYLNSVKGIRQVCDTCNLTPDDVKIVCAPNGRNRLTLGEYGISSMVSPNRPINFFTSKAFQGCNLFTDNGLVVVVSDANKSHTLTDISTTMEQIAGRIRNNDKISNCFRHILVHFFSTNSIMESEEDFNSRITTLEEEGKLLLEIYNKSSDAEKELLRKRISLENDVYSFIGNEIHYNELKKQSFIHKHQLRLTYKDGASVRNAFKDSERFKLTNQEYLDRFDIKLSSIVNIKFKDILTAYMEDPDDVYLEEYPKFADYYKYLTLREINTLRFNESKLDIAITDRKKLDQCFYKIYRPGFISNEDLKRLLYREFSDRGIVMTPKASLIKKCTLYNVTEASRWIDGKSIKGYELGEMKYKLANSK